LNDYQIILSPLFFKLKYDDKVKQSYKRFNVGIATVVEFLQKKGYTVEANPNTKITEEQYAMLVKEFSTDKNLRLESDVSFRNVKTKIATRHLFLSMVMIRRNRRRLLLTM